MDTEVHQVFYRRARSAARWLCLAVIAVGLLVLCGWVFDIEPLVRPIPHLVAMNPLTAISFCIAGCALLLLLPLQPSRNRVIGGSLLSVLLVIIALFRLLEYLPDWNVDEDMILFHKTVAAHSAGNVSNRMAPNTALLFLFTALGMAGLNGRGFMRRWPLSLFACFTCVGALITLLGYLYRVQLFYGALATLPMAIHTSLCFLGLGLALLFARPGRGIIREVVSTFAGGNTARMLLTAAIVVPLGLGVLVLLGYWRQVFTTELSVALLVFTLIISLCLLIWRNTRELNRYDREQIATNRALEIANKGLMQVNEELERFAYVSSHDLQEPLRKIRLYTSLLVSSGNKPHFDSREYAGKIDDAASRMSTLIKDLLYFTRVQQTDEAMTPTNLNEVLAQVLRDYEVTIAEKGALIKAGDLPVIPAIPSQASQLLSNLIGNALKFIQSKPVITITARDTNDADKAQMPGLDKDRQYITLMVSDNGIGFEQTYADKIFVMFQRLNSRTAFTGSGIGLAICKKIALNHHGDIRASGELNKGATFYVCLAK